MIQAVLLKLRPGSQFHFGRVSPDVNMALQDTDDHPHADTLFSAIVNVFADIFPESVPDLVIAFKLEQIRISSAFYCLANGGRRRFFLPAPAHWSTLLPDKSSRYAGVQFISQKAWEAGVTPHYLQDATDAAQYVLLQKRFLMHRSELTGSEISAAKSLQFFRKDTVPKIKIHSEEQDERLFFRTMLQIADNSRLFDRKKVPLTPDLRVHFYFLQETEAVFEQSDLYEQYQCALQVLADTGLGGERYTGCGHLEGIEMVPFAWNGPTEARVVQTKINLGIFSPLNDQALRSCTAYRTAVRGGRATAEDGQIQFVRMIAEGALATDTPAGTSHDLRTTNRQPYLRYGQGFWVDSPYPC